MLVEAHALLGRRLGLKAVQRFRDDFAALLTITWVDAPLHERGLGLLLERNDATLRLVDVVSFVIMIDQGITEAFAFDRHFTTEVILTAAPRRPS